MALRLEFGYAEDDPYAVSPAVAEALATRASVGVRLRRTILRRDQAPAEWVAVPPERIVWLAEESGDGQIVAVTARPRDTEALGAVRTELEATHPGVEIEVAEDEDG